MKKIIKIIVMASLFSVLAVSAYSASVVFKTHHGGGITSLTRKIYVNNAGTYTLVDSTVITSFEHEGTFTLNDSADYLVIRGWLFAGESDTLWAETFYPTNSRATVGFPGQADTIAYYAIDTVGVDAPVAGVQIDVYTDLDQPRVTAGITDANGRVLFQLPIGVTYYFRGTNPDLTFWNQDSVAHTGNTTDSIFGYTITFPVASTDSTCAVTITVLKTDRTPAKGIEITARLARSRIIDSAGFAYRNTTQKKRTNSNGQVTFNCVWSSFLIPQTKWIFSSTGLGGLRQEYIVPRQAVDTLNLAELR